MNEKILTITMPAYNSEGCIEKGLNSYLYADGSMDPRIELIIVNDGSTDRTGEIGKEWAERFPENVVLINKENGGHGSGINAGIDAASGKFFKVIDSDDWITEGSLKSVLDTLEEILEIEADNADEEEPVFIDAVITGYHTVNIASGAVIAYGTGQQMPPSEEQIKSLGRAYADLPIFGPKAMSMDELVADVNNIPAVQSFHGIMYKTEFYKGIGLRMSEKVFFEDQEYAVLPFAHVRYAALLPDFFYEYRIGSADQSVNFENQAKRAPQFRQVVERMVDYHLSHEMTSSQDEFLEWRIANAVTSYYAAVIVKNPDKENGIKLAEDFHAYIAEKEPRVAERAEKKYQSMLKFGKSKLTVKLYGALFNSKHFGKFKERWVK